MVRSPAVALRLPLPHRVLARQRPSSLRMRQRCASQFQTDVAVAVQGQPELLLLLASDAVADITIGIREARRAGPLWTPQTRAEMLEMAAIATRAITDAAGVHPGCLKLGDVQRSAHWGPSILVRLRPVGAEETVNG